MIKREGWRIREKLKKSGIFINEDGHIEGRRFMKEKEDGKLTLRYAKENRGCWRKQ